MKKYLTYINENFEDDLTFEKIMDYFAPMRAKRVELEQNLDYINLCLKDGAIRANQFAENTLLEVKKAVGLK